MAAWFKAWVCSRSLAGIAGSNTAGGTDVCLLWMLCCKVEVSVSGWSFVQRSPTECGVSECDREASTVRRHWPNRGCCSMGKNRKYEQNRTKQRGSWERMEITPVLPIAGQKFPRYFASYLEFLAVEIFQTSIGLYLIEKFLWNPKRCSPEAWLGRMLFIVMNILRRRRSQWPRGLRLGSTSARLLELCVRIPPRAWMSVCCECCVLSGRGFWDELVPRPEESYRVWCV
jgi:hypothetical protein